jgi:hypothetical protein
LAASIATIVAAVALAGMRTVRERVLTIGVGPLVVVKSSM